MKKLNTALAVGSLVIAVATVGSIVHANAQVSIRAGEHGVGVRIGDSHHRHGYWHRGYRAYGSVDCRYVETRKYRPNGTVVITKKRVCD
jgi:hypothetical protein